MARAVYHEASGCSWPPAATADKSSGIMRSPSFTIAEIFAAGCDDVAVEDTPRNEAQTVADANFAANAAALAASQAELARRIERLEIPLEFVFARDGFLTARDDGGWWTGCSVPLAAGRELLKTLELSGVVGCYVNPTHAGQLRACFERIAPHQAVIAIVPDLLTLGVMLRCDNFSHELRAGRLFFAGGWDWVGELERIFQDYPGLPLPQQFIRTALLEDDQLQRFAADAQAVVAVQTQRRSRRIALLRLRAGRRDKPSGRWVVVAGSQLRLGDLAAPALAAVLASTNVTHLDPDDPRQASPLAVAEAAVGADAIVVADVFRADMPDVLSGRTAWITWVTRDRLMPPDTQATRDGLILADPRWTAAAEQAGWNKNRMQIGGWPSVAQHNPRGRQSGKVKLLGLLADTFALEIPARIKQFSSHGLLWEMIAEELLANPLALGTDPHEYLQRRMAKLDVREEGLDRLAFLDRLIYPGYHQGLAELARRAGLPLALLGRGWDQMPQFAPHAAGPIRSMAALAIAVADCGALIHPSPQPTSHCVEALGIAVVQPAGMTGDRFVQSARRASAQARPPQRPQHPVLSKSIVQNLIDQAGW